MSAGVGSGTPHHQHVWLFAFVDVLLITVAALGCYIFMVMSSINPPAAQDNAPPPGTIAVSIGWPPNSDDVDLHVMAPGDKDVYFKRKNGKVFDLLRDDLGLINDPTPVNYETAFSRGMPDGEYVVNVRCFSCAELPVTVAVEVRITANGQSQLLFSGPVELRRDKETKTALRFTVSGGAVVPDSLNQIFKEVE